METIQEVENKVMIEPIVRYKEEEIKFNACPEIPNRLKRIFKWDDFVLRHIPSESIQPIKLKEYS